MANFPVGRDEVYEALMNQIMSCRKELILVFKELQSNTESYPLLNQTQLIDWFKMINVISGNFTILDFQIIFKEVKIGGVKIKHLQQSQK
jgi:hypothetical protein